MANSYSHPYLFFLKKFKKKIVFTNGCFDIVHVGHLHYLKESRMLGDALVVGLNSDNSIRRLKGNNRPINNIYSRKAFLEELPFIDLVIEFDEDTPINLIKSIMPDILVKGGDYKVEEIVGAEFVLSNGGNVLVLPFIDGYSTTKLINKINHKF